MTDIEKDMAKLWVLCFEDPLDLAEEFFSLEDIETLTEEFHGQLAGMASLVPVADSRGGRGFYVYGVCVDPRFRGRGIFRRLMERCESMGRRREMDYLCLIPVNGRMADTYRRMGYSIPVSLCDVEKGDIGIFSASESFRQYADTDEDSFSGSSCGLLKPIGKALDSERNFYFSHRMGEC